VKILNKIKEIQKRELTETDEQKGISETEIAFLNILLEDLENQN